MQQPHVVIIGGSYAGLMAASRIARQHCASITLVDQSPAFIQRIRLHQLLSGQTVKSADLATLLEPAGIRFICDRVTGIDPHQRQITTATDQIKFDYLVIASGSQIDRQRIPGAATFSQCLGSMTDVQQLAGQLPALARRRGHLLLIGAGLTQLETATELAERLPGLRISLVTRGRAFTAFTARADQYLRRHLAQAGIRLLEQQPVQAVEAGRCITDQGAIEFDLCLNAPGFTASALAQQLRQPLDPSNRVPVTPTLQLPGHDRIWLAGDIATPPWPGPAPLRMSCAAALPLGACAGENVAAAITGEPQQAFRLGFFFRCVSLGRKAGLVQLTQWDDAPKARFFSGRQGAWIKEQVCRMAFKVPQWELRTGWRLYQWPQSPQMPDALETLQE